MYRLSFLLLLQALAWTSTCCAAVAGPAGAPLVSLAEQPFRLLRGTGNYVAGRGARLQDGDIVATSTSSTSGIQIEADGATVALGPATQVYITVKASTNFVLLNGWMKIQSGANPNNPVSASAGGLHVSVANSAVNNAFILHAGAGKTELFVESGEALVDQAQAGQHRQLRLAREQYAAGVRNAQQPMTLLPRPSRQFSSDMPPVFADRLAPLASSAAPAPAAPRLDHPAVFAEVAPWLADEPALRQSLQRRLAPRKIVAAPAAQLVPR